MSGDTSGGAEKMLLELANVLEELEYKVNFVFNSNINIPTSINDKRHRYFLIKFNNFLDIKNLFSFVIQLIKFIFIISTNKYEKIIIENKFLLQFANFLPHKKIIAYVHYPPSKYELRKCHYKKLYKIILCCDGLRKYFVPEIEYSSKLLTLPNYIDLGRKKSKVSKGIKNNSHYTLTNIGHISEIKNQKLFIESIYEISKTLDNVKGIIVGEAREQSKGYYNECLELVKKYSLHDKITFLGQTDDVSAILDKTDIMLHLSKKEGLPLVILEAMQKGIPVIASNIDGIPEAVIDNHNGYIISDNNLNTIKDRVLNLLNKEDIYSNFSNNSMLLYENSFTKEVYKNNSIKILNKI